MVANSRGCFLQCGELDGKACGEVQGYLNLCKHSLTPLDNDVCPSDSAPPMSHIKQKLSSNTFLSSTRSVSRAWYGIQASYAPLVSTLAGPPIYMNDRNSRLTVDTVRYSISGWTYPIYTLTTSLCFLMQVLPSMVSKT